MCNKNNGKEHNIPSKRSLWWYCSSDSTGVFVNNSLICKDVLDNPRVSVSLPMLRLNMSSCPDRSSTLITMAWPISQTYHQLCQLESGLSLRPLVNPVKNGLAFLPDLSSTLLTRVWSIFHSYRQLCQQESGQSSRHIVNSVNIGLVYFPELGTTWVQYYVEES